MSIRVWGLLGWVVSILAGGPLGAQEAKPRPKPSPAPTSAPSKVLWRYDTPRDFTLLEPAYRLPTQVKQALVQFVQPVPELSQAYATVFTDKRKFSSWLKSVLLDRKKAATREAESAPTVLSSDPSKMSTGKGTVTSTAKTRPRAAREQDDIDRYLTVLKVWDTE